MNVVLIVVSVTPMPAVLILLDLSAVDVTQDIEETDFIVKVRTLLLLVNRSITLPNRESPLDYYNQGGK